MENQITYSKTSPISEEKFDRLFEILEYSFPPCERGNYADKPRENLRQADEQNTQHAQRCGHHDIADLCGSHR